MPRYERIQQFLYEISMTITQSLDESKEISSQRAQCHSGAMAIDRLNKKETSLEIDLQLNISNRKL